MQGFNALAQSFVSGVVGGMITSEIYGGEFSANFAHGFIGSYIDYTQNALEGILDTDFTLIEALELTMDFVPVVSNLKAAYEFSTGETIFGGIELEPLDRNLAAASIFLGPVAKAAVKTTKVAVTVVRHSDEAADLLTASSKVHDATKATDAALDVTNRVVRSSDDVFELAIKQGPESLAGFTIDGAKQMVGNTFQRDVLRIATDAGSGRGSIKKLLGAFESEAKGAGASSLRIVGHEIQNATFFRNAGLAQKLGYQFNKIDDKTFEIVKSL
ncbi:pre-toxin TG domain-containing protein [Vibrio neptunius]|uniref:pre-toxin TG domain-containing protein n=1 Tax=Vibrio neptunius TaxID=170651 RepID=UPI003CE57031